MIYHHPGNQRGTSQFSWLESRHSFSFGHYYDPTHMGFKNLRVINDDTVAPGAGFGQHGHRNMEILSYILEGAIEHQDSLGNRFVVPAGELQRMTAGRGIAHSEYNASATEPLRFLQIWVTPNQRNLPPSYEQKAIAQTSALTPMATPDGRDGSLRIHQNTSLYRLRLSKGEQHTLGGDHSSGYLHVVSGNGDSGEYRLNEGDGIGLEKHTRTVTATSDHFEALWFKFGVN